MMGIYKNDSINDETINPCKGCEDYEPPNGCKSKGGCAPGFKDIDAPFEEIVQAVKDGIIKDNGYIYNKKINDSVEIQIHVKIQDKRMTTCMGLLDDWRKGLK